MKKKRKIVIALLLAAGIFINISSSTSINVTHSANSLVTLSDEGPIEGNHWKIIDYVKKLYAIIQFERKKKNY